MEIHKRNVVIKCHECGRDYEDTQVIVDGIPSYKFHICPECQRKLVEAVFGNNGNNIRK